MAEAFLVLVTPPPSQAETFDQQPGSKEARSKVYEAVGRIALLPFINFTVDKELGVDAIVAAKDTGLDRAKCYEASKVLAEDLVNLSTGVRLVH
jgi:hypothetical protein